MKRIPGASLKQLNSFSVEARAGQLLILESEEDFQTFTSEHRFDVKRDLILGGGSNILFAGDVGQRGIEPDHREENHRRFKR